MILNGLDRESIEASGFFTCAVGRRLAADPVGLMDVGARWGISDEFAVAAPLFAALAFEPDPDEVPSVEAKGRAERWATFGVAPIALGREAGTISLNLYSRANNSSIYSVSESAKRRYNLGGFDLERVLSVPTSSLDAVVFGEDGGTRRGEVVKLDTQGAELEIIRGGRRTLSERTVCLITEAHFFALYDGAPYFADIDKELRDLGFTFIGFSDFQNRSSKRLDKRKYWGRERLFQADAIYFRDPALDGTMPDRRAIDVAIFLAVLLGFFDLALEWASVGARAGLDMTGTREAIERVTTAMNGSLLAELERTVSMARRNPALSHVIAGKFVDMHRDLATFHDVPLPAEETARA